jgi:hypothetical protein
MVSGYISTQLKMTVSIFSQQKMGQISFGIGTFSILKMLNITFETINGFPTRQSATLPNSKVGLYLHREMAFWPPYSNLENGWQMASRDAVFPVTLLSSPLRH